jgi:hypothetical protein
MHILATAAHSGFSNLAAFDRQPDVKDGWLSSSEGRFMLVVEYGRYPLWPRPYCPIELLKSCTLSLGVSKSVFLYAHHMTSGGWSAALTTIT